MATAALQIVMVERYANRFDAFALTFAEIAIACLVFAGIALALGDLSMPHGATVWAAILVTGLAGYLFAGDRIGAVGLAGCAAIFAGILVAQPMAAATLRRLVVGLRSPV